MEKECFKCGIIKPLSEFYKHSRMGDGHLNKCKECTKSDSLLHRSENIDKVKEYDRNRPNKAERVIKNKERLKKDPIAYKQMKVKNSEWGKRNRHKRNAHLKLSRAVLKGVVIRKFECEKCTSTIQVEAHHEDYEKPLEVIWLCSKCHHERHVELRKIERGYEDNNMNSFKTKHQYNDSSILDKNEADIKLLFDAKSGKQLVCRKYNVSINTLVKWINEKENQ